MIKVSAIRCPICHDLIYSRARHDYRSCSCGNVSVDGGFDYLKISALKDVAKVLTVEVKVNATKEELYKDWNSRKDKFGLIKGGGK